MLGLASCLCVDLATVPRGPSPRTKGNSTVSIDNSAGNLDAFVKLVADPRSTAAHSVAWLLVRAHDRFTVKHLPSGSYATYYQDMSSGYSDKSPPFELAEHRYADSTERRQYFTKYEITLYTRVDGNIQMTSINQDEFAAVDRGVTAGLHSDSH